MDRRICIGGVRSHTYLSREHAPAGVFCIRIVFSASAFCAEAMTEAGRISNLQRNSMNIVEEDIRSGRFKKVYLLCGEEAYLKEYYRKKLQKAVIREDDTINYNRYVGKEADPSAIISQADTLPFFADYRLLLIVGSGLLKKDGDLLADYLPQMPESTVLLFVEDEIDRRCRLYKAIQKNGAVLELKHPREDELVRWITRRFQHYGKEISQSCARLLLQKAGDDMSRLESEIGKVVSYLGERQSATKADLDAVCSELLENRVFAMIDAAAFGETDRALALYRNLVFLREPSFKILVLIGNHFRRLYFVRDLRDQGFDRREVENRTGFSSFIARPLIGQAERMDLSQIRSIMELCAQMDEAIKTGRMQDQLAVETVITRICKMTSSAGTAKKQI